MAEGTTEQMALSVGCCLWATLRMAFFAVWVFIDCVGMAVRRWIFLLHAKAIEVLVFPTSMRMQFISAYFQ